MYKTYLRSSISFQKQKPTVSNFYSCQNKLYIYSLILTVLVRYLRDEKAQFHTFQSKEDKPTIAQCTNCQDYGHTKAYCGHPPRCVRCGKDHHSSSCLKSRDEPPCCALCHGNHPASYKGCSTYKELQHRKKSNSNNKKFFFDTKDTNFKSNFVQDNHPVGPTPTNSPKGQNQSYAEAVANQTARHELPPSTPNTSSPSESNIDLLMTSFLNDFKTLINPLISLLTKVISSLLDKKNE